VQQQEAVLVLAGHSIQLRLVAMCPRRESHISLAYVGPPAVKVQLSPYNIVRLMRIPVLQLRGGDGRDKFNAAAGSRARVGMGI
jgi:hypothetical protein